MTFFFQLLRVDTETDKEHENNHADLAQGIQKSKAGYRKKDTWSKAARSNPRGWPQHNAGEHLAHHVCDTYVCTLDMPPAYWFYLFRTLAQGC